MIFTNHYDDKGNLESVTVDAFDQEVTISNHFLGLLKSTVGRNTNGVLAIFGIDGNRIEIKCANGEAKYLIESDSDILDGTPDASERKTYHAKLIQHIMY